jgi:hypothetical protein
MPCFAGYNLNPLWIIAGFFFTVLGCVVACIPHRILRLARQNCVRLDGSVSRRRQRRELNRFLEFTASLLVIPMLIVGTMGGIVTLVHVKIVPIPMVVDIFGAFSLDAAAWEHAIEREDLGDVGAAYECWSKAQGFEHTSARFWQAFLWKHWPTLAGFGVLLGGLCYWFATRYYASTVRQFETSVLQRRARYLRKDHRRFRATSGPPEGISRT